jgi:PHD/YefM family antitoxin component YafN of YafNO toxin-antitoxin module
MQVFTSEELQRRPADVQQSALVEPTFITFHGRPRLVMMSLDEFDRLRGRRHTVLNAAALSEDVLAEMRRIADEYPVEDSEIKLIGGLLEEDIGSRTPGPG